MRGVDVAVTAHKPGPPPVIPHGQRNSALWNECMRAARRCNSFNALLDIAKEINM